VGEEEAWLQHAEYDLEVARTALAAGLFAQCLISCQQAVEKALKAAYIQKYGQAAPRIHDLIRLARDTDLEHRLQPPLPGLTLWYLEARYPDLADVPAFQRVPREAAQEALAATETFVAAVRSEFGAKE
jgi:HEPN domain-containing protein